jgi:hypothetical protein
MIQLTTLLYTYSSTKLLLSPFANSNRVRSNLAAKWRCQSPFSASIQTDRAALWPTTVLLVHGMKAEIWIPVQFSTFPSPSFLPRGLLRRAVPPQTSPRPCELTIASQPTKPQPQLRLRLLDLLYLLLESISWR